MSRVLQRIFEIRRFGRYVDCASFFGLAITIALHWLLAGWLGVNDRPPKLSGL